MSSGCGLRAHLTLKSAKIQDPAHRTQRNTRFSLRLASKRAVCLDIADDQEVVQAELVGLLEGRVGKELGRG